MSEEAARPAACEDVEPEEEGARTTVRPPFNPAQFARESDSRIGLEPEPPSARPTTPPPPGLPQYGPTGGAAMHAQASVGPDAVPSLAVAREDLECFELPQLTRDLLRQVDGHSTLATLCARGAFALEAATAACHELERQGIVTLRRGPSTSA
jgi:hypothetical protein